VPDDDHVGNRFATDAPPASLSAAGDPPSPVSTEVPVGGIGNIIWIIIGGAIIGVIARLLLPGRQAIPWWAVIGAGIVGMFVGDFIAQALGVKETSGFDWIRHILQLVVGVVAVGGAATLMGRTST
jgi:uncharacterized membrane protein YeaQ/YmgE (transglycosylase-associated protein family)